MHRKILSVIQEEVNQYLNEEFIDGNLYGYHCTPCKNLESIEQSGFNIGSRSMQGEGVYAFYNLQDNSSGNAAVGYGSRHLGDEFCIVKFVIKYPHWLLILIKRIADEVLGANADIVKQIEEQFGDWDTYMNLIFRYMKPEYHTQEFSEQHKNWMREKFDKDNEVGSQYLMFGIAYLGDVAKFGVIYHGEYGIQFLIKKPTIMQPIGYYNVKIVNGSREVSEYIPFTGKIDALQNKISSDAKYDALKEYLPSIKTVEDLQLFKHKFDEKRKTVRNNREFDYYTNLIDLLDELIDPHENLNEDEDYRGEHQAPSKNGDDSPMYDVTNQFGEDIYGSNAVRMYGGYGSYDSYSIALIQRARNKPNMQVKIYRAVPKVISNQEKIGDYEKRMKEIHRRGKLPRDVDNFRNASEYYNWLDSEVERLKTLPSEDIEKVKINNGDWVTINPMYAKVHGQSNLNNMFRVLSKTVSAKQLYTDGNSIHEWGYSALNENLDEGLLNEKTYKVYHGTNQQFNKFNIKNATQGIVWFTDSIDSIKNQEHGGMGNKIIMTRYITINNPAYWEEYEKYGLQQLQDRGYDGVILPQGDKTDYIVFSNKSISAKEPSNLNESQKSGIRNILNSDAAYQILDNSSAGESTWCAGGCAILAYALKMVYGYPIYVIYDYNYKRTQHFIVQTPRGTYIDCDGEQKDILRNFIRKEYFEEKFKGVKPNLKILPYTEDLKNDSIPIDMNASQKLAELIKNSENANQR